MKSVKHYLRGPFVTITTLEWSICYENHPKSVNPGNAFSSRTGLSLYSLSPLPAFHSWNSLNEFYAITFWFMSMQRGEEEGQEEILIY